MAARNASGNNGGAAAALCMSEEEAVCSGSQPLARIDRRIMSTGPILASRMAPEKTDWKISVLDLVEAN